MSELKKKLGPLPVWAWALLGFGLFAILYYEHEKSSSSSSSSIAANAGLNQVDPETGMTYAQEAALSQQGIDPLTGMTYAQEYGAGTAALGGDGGGGSAGGSTPTPLPGGPGPVDGGTTASDLPFQLPFDTATLGQLLSLYGEMAPTPGAAAQPGPASTPGPTPAPTPKPHPAAAVAHATTAASTAAHRFVDRLGGGNAIENFRPAHPGSNETTKSLGNGLYATMPKVTHKHVTSKKHKPKPPAKHRRDTGMVGIMTRARRT